ncbi:MAG: DNA repair protein RecN [Burkholderiaceae bacterium]|nr:DNA repair protein RecN [Burkholderiaceae bacterium]
MALKRMALRDFVIVRELDIDLAAGFTVLTGETGAGKSILIDALQLALGARADSTWVREGASRAEVSAEFEVPAGRQNWLNHWLQEAGFESDGTLLLRRTVDTQGKSRAWINGSSATATQLKTLGDELVDIHGQHAWATLSRPDAVRGLLDAYAGNTSQQLSIYWSTWRQAGKALENAQKAQDTLQNERERVLWQISEVGKLAPGADEWVELNAQHAKLSNAQSLIEAAQTALNTLQDDDNDSGTGASLGVIAGLVKAQLALQNRAQIEPEFQTLSEVLASNLAQIEDAAHSLSGYLRQTELEPERLEQLDERLSLWLSLARRYKRTPAELPALLASWKEELTRLDASTDLAALELSEQAAAKAYWAEALAISKKRQKAAPKLAVAITEAMQGLGMQGGAFEVALTPLDSPSEAGLEDISFLVAGHAGSTPRPVGKVASGGELSRIALAISVVTSQLGTAQTLIFDEVDSGVGGAVAETVGRLMKQLGVDRQVLAVTHLPQVAACADHHLVVAKQLVGSSTESSVSPVLGKQRVAEIARMLGGERVSDATLAHATEMIAVQANNTPAKAIFTPKTRVLTQESA